MLHTFCHLRISRLVALFAFAMFIAPPIASAGFLGNLVTIEAVNADGRGTWQMAIPPDPPDTIDYSNPNVVELRDANQMLIGTVDDLVVHLDGDPVAAITFSATAGASATTFTVSSATVSFPAIANPAANATAEITLTDTSTNGASLTPVSPNTGVFLPTYNGSTIYDQLVGPTTITSGGSITASESFGDPIAGSVSSIQARFQFTLSATDTVSGTGRFEVVPEPATALLLTLGTFVFAVLCWRRNTSRSKAIA